MDSVVATGELASKHCHDSLLLLLAPSLSPSALTVTLTVTQLW